LSVKVTDAYHQTSAETGKEASWRLTGHVEYSTMNPVLLYWYVDGPSPSIKPVRNDGYQDEVKKGEKLIVNSRAGAVSACTSFSSTDYYRGVIFGDPGTYRIRLATGRIVGGLELAGVSPTQQLIMSLPFGLIPLLAVGGILALSEYRR
jgi:hypothetical protein